MEQAADATTVRELREQLAALTRLVATQQATLDRLESGAAARASRETMAARTESRVSRRGALTKVLGATAAAAVLTIATKPSTAEATASATVVLGSSAAYGVLASPGTVGAPTAPILGSTTHGVIGSSTVTVAAVVSSGVLGARNGAGFAGIHGVNVGGFGVHGASDSGVGTFGQSNSAAGVQGTSTTAYGVQGLSTNAYGVSGNSTTQAGVWGSSNSNVGVLGTSTSGVGVNGVSSSSNGVNGLSTTGIGVYGSSPGGQAGRFDGNVLINGNLTVTGTFPTTAAAPSTDGTLRRIYSLGAPEAFYEDFGQGSTTNGVGTVRLDPEFAGLIRTDAYQVFLTAYDDSRGLFVSNQTANGFEVREVQGGTSSVGFGYRVLARPRATVSPRLDTVTVPPAPPQSKLDQIEPLDVPRTLRDIANRTTDGPARGPER
jgi:hypothetical protein